MRRCSRGKRRTSLRRGWEGEKPARSRGLLEAVPIQGKGGVARRAPVLVQRAVSEEKGSRQTILLARGTPTINKTEGHPRRCCAPGTRALGRASFDGRSGTDMGALPREEQLASLEGAFTEMVVAWEIARLGAARVGG
jgi:hypothetical protein